MSDKDQFRILHKGVDVWNTWRKKNNKVRVNLRGSNLREADLRGANLSDALLERIDFSDADLSDVDFTNSNLGGANFFGAELQTAIFRGANLREVNLQAASLIGNDLSGANLNQADLESAILSRANLKSASLMNANLQSAALQYANLERASLIGANLKGANLTGAILTNAMLGETDLGKANLTEADLSNADLKYANLTAANLTNANLSFSNLHHTNLMLAKVDNASISNSKVYGANVWDLKGEFKEQLQLIVTPEKESVITVDNIEIAQFVYLLLNNKKIRNVIDTVTTKTALILGRFYAERKQVLDALKEALRKRGFVPILFDFEPSKQRDLTETVQLLANMAKFVIADITDAKSIPQELSHIIPLLPSVPVQPILLISEREYAMFEHWRGFKTVLPEFLYRDKQDLVDNLEAKILQPINAWRKDQDEISVLKERIKELEAKKG